MYKFSAFCLAILLFVSCRKTNNNGPACTFDQAKSFSEIFITRNDAAPGGYMEGWYSVYYKDAANVSKNITGNFRVKKVP